MRRKKCRAAACSRKVPDTHLFCNVHLGTLASRPSLLTHIRENREAPDGANPTILKQILIATGEAVRFIARKEGRASELARAERTGLYDPGQGGAGNEPGARPDNTTRPGTTRPDLR